MKGATVQKATTMTDVEELAGTIRSLLVWVYLKKNHDGG